MYRFAQRFDESIDFLRRIVKHERCPYGSGNTEPVHHRLGAMMTGTHGNTLGVEEHANIQCIKAFNDE